MLVSAVTFESKTRGRDCDARVSNDEAALKARQGRFHSNAKVIYYARMFEKFLD